MNKEQQEFYDFIMERVMSDCDAEAECMLKEGFSKQESGEYTATYMADYCPRMLKVIGDMYQEEVKNVMMRRVNV